MSGTKASGSEGTTDAGSDGAEHGGREGQALVQEGCRAERPGAWPGGRRPGASPCEGADGASARALSLGRRDDVFSYGTEVSSCMPVAVELGT